jgi:hypothetical protein
MYAYKNSEGCYLYGSREELQQAFPDLPEGFLTPDVLNQYEILNYKMTIPETPGFEMLMTINQQTHWIKEVTENQWEVYERDTPLAS